MMKRKGSLFIWIALVYIIYFLSLVPKAKAYESTNVSIPVVATGSDCTVVLTKNNAVGTIPQKLELKKDVQETFEIECVGMQRNEYSIWVSDHDNNDVKYDKTIYSVSVQLYYEQNDQINYTTTVTSTDEKGNVSQKKSAEILFNNIVNETPIDPSTRPSDSPVEQPEETDTVTPETTGEMTPSVTPVPTQETTPYNVYFSFRKVWQGDHEDSIDWSMYRANGSLREKRFNKKVISSNEWKYEAYFPQGEDVSGYYILETPMDGYMVRYENVGAHAGETDRCYNGGTIINYKVPNTSDGFPYELYFALSGCSLAGIVLLLTFSRRRRKFMGGEHDA